VPVTRADRPDLWLHWRSENLLRSTARITAVIVNSAKRARPAPTIEQLAAPPPYGPQDKVVRELIDDAVDGDPLATQLLLESVRPHVLRYCRARVGRLDHSYDSADDVAQEVCLALLTALPTYRDQGRPFLALVYGIAQHKVASAHRASMRERTRTQPVSEVPDQPTQAAGPEQRALQAEMTVSMRRLLTPLSVRQREILVLRVVLGLSAEQTATLVGSTPTAVRAAQHRALRRLRGLAPFMPLWD
jgi:RNA polymerase sigma-70 factor (ECF subfamily)